jgi:hypothetical protein
MKNYLIKGLHRIGDPKWWPGSDRSHEGNLYPLYAEMNQLSEASFMHFMEGDWELINLVSEAKDVNHVFRQQFLAIAKLWDSEPCNIFYCGSDTQMIQPTTVFGQYDHFMMFNYTDPKSFGPCTHFLNADVRYYPHNMRREIWEYALKQIDGLTWWNSDQLLYNQMVWCQGLGAKEVINPRMAYQGMMLPDSSRADSDAWNGCRLEEANIIHWHGSRGAEKKLSLMRNINALLNVPELPQRHITKQVIDVSYIP